MYIVAKKTHFAEVWYLDVHSSPKSCAEVGGACQDVAQVLVPHELMVILLDKILHLHA